MKEIMGKICRNRVLWSVVGILLVLYFFIEMHGVNPVQRFGIYFDEMTPTFLGAVVLLMLYISGMVKDFLNGFRIAFTKKETFPATKILRAVKVFNCAERTAVAAGVILHSKHLTSLNPIILPLYSQ